MWLDNIVNNWWLSAGPQWLVLGVCLVLHIPAIWCGFVGDDLEILKRTEDAKTPPPGFWRRQLAHFGGAAYWEKYSREAHAIPLIIHAAVCLLIARLWGPLAAAFFCIHPATQEVSMWLSAKAYGMTAMCVLLAWWLPLLAFPLFGMVPWECFYFTGLPAPFLFLWKPWPGNLAFLVLAWLCYKHLRFIFNPKRNIKAVAYEDNAYTGRLSPVKAIIFLKFLGYAFVNGLVCIHSCYYHSYLENYADSREGIRKGKELDWYFAVGVVIVYITITNIFFGPHTQALFGLYWFILFMSMWCNALGFGQQHIANRYYYLPYIGVAIMLSTFPAWIVYILIGLNIREFIYNTRQFKDGFWHLTWQVWNAPWFYYSWLLMGILHFHRGHFTRAIGDFKQALVCRPDNFKALFNLSSCHIARGEFKEAHKYIKLAMAADVYGQEKHAKTVMDERMRLMIWIMKNYEKIRRREITLRTEDIPMVM